MKKHLTLLLAGIFLQMVYHNVIAQTRLFTRSVSATNQSIYNNLKSQAEGGKIDIFEFEPNLSSKKLLTVLLNGVNVEFTLQELDVRGSDDYTWFGKDKTGGSISLTYINGQLAGSIDHNVISYTITPYGKNTSALFTSSVDNASFLEPSEQMKAIKMPKPNGLRLATGDSTTIRILIAYTDSVEKLVRKFYNRSMKMHLQVGIDNVNLRFRNSNVAHRVRLACGIKVSYPQETTDDYNHLLSKFWGTSDGTMDEIHAYRNYYSADVCVLYVLHLISPFPGVPGAAGIALQVGSTPSTAFCAVIWNGADNSYTAHEIAHLHGCRHNPENDSGTYPYPYGHGYRNPAKYWMTVMSYNCAPTTCARTIPYFSNPDLNYNGDPLGTAGVHNNARVLNENGATLAGFRTAPLALVLNDSAKLDDGETGQAIATSEILLTGNFEVIGNSDFTGIVSASASDVDYAPNRIGLDQEQILTDETGQELFTLYPNPNTGRFTIKRSDGKSANVDLSIYNVAGRKVNIKSRQLNDSVEVDITHNGPGVYFVRINEGDKVFSRKIVIQ